MDDKSREGKAWQESMMLYEVLREAMREVVIDLDGQRFRIGDISDNAILLNSKTETGSTVGIALTEAYGEKWLAIVIPLED